MNFKVNSELCNIRIDKYIPLVYSEVSRSELRSYFDDGKILVNGKVVKPSYKVQENDDVCVEEKEKAPLTIAKEEMDLHIVYEDESIIIVNKPSGIVVHPSCGHHEHTLVNGLVNHCDTLSDVSGDNRLGIVHRIDKDTTGLLVIAKNNKVHRHLQEQFKTKQTTKRCYYAIVSGVIPHEKGRVNAPIGRDPNNRQKMAVVEGGKEAITNFTVLERFKNNTLIECSLETGRTHQIRVHMSYIGFPILNDPLYGIKKQTTPFGQYLHAHSLGFIHPTTNEEVLFESELPVEFSEMLNELRK